MQQMQGCLLKRVEGVLEVAKAKQNQDCDSVFAVVGPERSGKSMLMLHMMEYLEAEAEWISMDAIESMDKIGIIPHKGCHQIDEAISGAMTREAMSKQNSNLIRVFSTIGKKNLIVFLGIPDFFLLETYLRKFRLAGLFWVYKRGKVAFFGRKAIKKICLYGEKSHEIKGARPYFYDTYPDYKGHMRAKYDKIEEAWKNSKWVEKKKEDDPKAVKIHRMLLDRRHVYSIEDIAKELKVSTQYIHVVKKKILNE